MLKTLKNNIWLLLALVVNIFVFARIFSLEPLVGGDAPHLSPQLLREFADEPQVWTQIGINFGGVNPRLYLSPLMFVFSIPHTLLGIDHEVLVRLFFYIPAILLSIFGSYFFARRLEFSDRISALVALIYSINTYFILLIDGGQVGIALAYGMFPLALLSLLLLNKKPGIKNFYIALITLCLMTIADPRVAILVVLTWFTLAIFGVWGAGLTRKSLKLISLLLIALAGLNMYWIYPLLKVGGGEIPGGVNLEFMSILNGLTFFQPHWPGNIFGQIKQPHWYFMGLFVLVSIGAFLRAKRERVALFVVFLLFVFLLKGTNAPLGDIYKTIISLPFGISFRDSSKFFTPIMLLGGMLIALGVQRLEKTFKNSSPFIYIPVFIYIVLLVYPAYTGKMNFVLSGDVYSREIENINKILMEKSEFTRTAWIPERHPQVLGSSQSQALDGKSLADLRPLADMTTGSSDKFNYTYPNEDFLDWYQLMGIDYIVMSGDTRNPNPNNEEIENWNRLTVRLNEVKELETLDKKLLGLQGSYPNLYFVPHIYAVVGPFVQDPSPEHAYIYFEDGKLNHELLNGIDPETLTIIYNNKKEKDLLMSFLQDHFINLSQVQKNEWAYFGPDEYLLNKYQLLIKGVDYKEFDYQQGASLSTNPDEVLEVELVAEEDADYILVIRGIGNVDIQFADIHEVNEFGAGYSWYTKRISLEEGKHLLRIANNSKLSVLNTLALVPADDHNEAMENTEVFTTHFSTIDMIELRVLKNDGQGPALSPAALTLEQHNHYSFDLTDPGESGFVVFTDSYHPRWQLRKGTEYYAPLPVYSEFNAFYVDDSWTDMNIEFLGQKEFRKGLYLTLLTVLCLVVIYLYRTSNNRP